jgi:hypothetical protein
VLFLLLSCAALFGPGQDRLIAQETRGTITGAVTDPSVPDGWLRIRLAS